MKTPKPPPMTYPQPPADTFMIPGSGRKLQVCGVTVSVTRRRHYSPYLDQRAQKVNAALARYVAAARQATLLEAAEELDEHAAAVRVFANVARSAEEARDFRIEANSIASAAEKVRARARQEPT